MSCQQLNKRDAEYDNGNPASRFLPFYFLGPLEREGVCEAKILADGNERAVLFRQPPNSLDMREPSAIERASTTAWRALLARRSPRLCHYYVHLTGEWWGRAHFLHTPQYPGDEYRGAWLRPVVDMDAEIAGWSFVETLSKRHAAMATPA